MAPGAAKKASASGPSADGGATAASSHTHVDLQMLDGVRALASIGVVLLHCFMFWQFFLDHETKYRLTASNPVIRQAGLAWCRRGPHALR